MSEPKTELLQTKVEKALAVKVRAQADAVDNTVSGFIRYVLRQWCDADAVTLERARLTDPGVAYETGDGDG